MYHSTLGLREIIKKKKASPRREAHNLQERERGFELHEPIHQAMLGSVMKVDGAVPVWFLELPP